MTPPIEDITDPGQFLPGPLPVWHSWWFWSVVIPGALLAGMIFYRIYRKKTVIPASQSLLELARGQLEALRCEAGNLEPQAAAVRISLIIREYLEAAYNDPILFETSEEFTLRPDALAKLHPDCRTAVVEQLTELSELKYFPPGKSYPIDDLINRGADILARIEEMLASPDSSPSE